MARHRVLRSRPVCDRSRADCGGMHLHRPDDPGAGRQPLSDLGCLSGGHPDRSGGPAVGRWASRWFDRRRGVALGFVTAAGSALGQRPDGAPPTVDDGPLVRWGLTRRQAVREPMFWVLASGAGVSGALCTSWVSSGVPWPPRGGPPSGLGWPSARVTGGSQEVLLAGCVLPVLVAVAALVVRSPRGPSHTRGLKHPSLTTVTPR